MSSSDRRDARVGLVAVAVSAACVSLVAVTALALIVPSIRAWMITDSARPGYVEGQQIDLDPRGYESNEYTIYLFSQASCRACQASRPVMAAIASDVAHRPNVKVMLVAGGDRPDEEEDFAQAIGLDASNVIEAEMDRLRVRYVPTVVLTDRSGKILLMREGLLTELDRLEVVRMSDSAVPN